MKYRAALLALVVVVAPTPARANIHKEDFFAAGSYVNQSSLFGFYVSEAKTLGKHGEHPPDPAHQPDGGTTTDDAHHWSRVFEAGAQFAGDKDRVYTLMGGIRWAGRARKASPDAGDFPSTLQMAFVQVVAGVAHRDDGERGKTEAAVAVGGGWDFYFGKARKAGLRLQADAVLPGLDEVFPRISVGFVYRWPKPRPTR